MFKKLLGYYIYSGNKENLYKEIKERKKVHIISGNSEIIYKGYKNNQLDKIYKDEEALLIADGIGTVLASKLIGNPIEEKIAGIDFMEFLIKKSLEENLPIYLLGAKKEVVEKAVLNLKKKYKAINIVGFSDGYFDLDNCAEIIKKINLSKAKILFVAMGNPKQEKFIDKYKAVLNCKIFMGVGGSFDVFSGIAKRAPKIFLKLNLEWFYRVLRNPSRIFRLKHLLGFIFLIRKEHRR